MDGLSGRGKAMLAFNATSAGGAEPRWLHSATPPATRMTAPAAAAHTRHDRRRMMRASTVALCGSLMVTQPGEGPRLVALHKGRVTNNVGCQDATSSRRWQDLPKPRSLSWRLFKAKASSAAMREIPRRKSAGFDSDRTEITTMRWDESVVGQRERLPT
jgi:hypothetical protein